VFNPPPDGGVPLGWSPKIKFYLNVSRWPAYQMVYIGNIAENFNRLSKAHERYRQTTDDRQTDGRWHQHAMELTVTFVRMPDDRPGLLRVGYSFYTQLTQSSTSTSKKHELYLWARVLEKIVLISMHICPWACVNSSINCKHTFKHYWFIHTVLNKKPRVHLFWITI